MSRLPIRQVLLSTLLIAMLVVLGENLSAAGLVDEQLLPPPSAIAAALIDGVASGLFLEHLRVTSVRLAYGVAIAVLVAVPIGVAVGFSPRTRGVLWPILVFLYPVPVSVLIPLFIGLFGITTTLYASLVALTTGIPIALAAADAVRRVSPVLVETGRTLGVRRHRIPTRIVFPAALPGLLHGTYVAVSIGVVVLITVEILTSSQGIGHVIVLAQRQYQVPEMYAAIVVVGVFGSLVAALARLPSRLLTAS